MSMLKRIRRSRRTARPKLRRVRKLDKFIPDADSDFAFTADEFASYIARNPDAYQLVAEDAARITKAVSEFRMALAKALHRQSCSRQTLLEKDIARKAAEDVVRLYGNIIRAAPEIEEVHKKLVRVKVRPKKLKPRLCPKQPPVLTFDGAGPIVHGSSAPPVHILRFSAPAAGKLGRSGAAGGIASGFASSRAKPEGAARLELFIDFVPPGEPIPKTPLSRTGRPWYLRSFSSSPFEVEFPMPASGPMLVVYWGRWASATGEVSAWSRPCVARVEGWSSTTALAPADGHSRMTHVSSPVIGALPQGTLAARIETKYLYVQPSYMLESEGEPGEDELHCSRR